MEIERKWLFSSPDAARQNLTILEHFSYWQGYLSTSPEVRIAHKVNYSAGEYSYRLAIKSKGTLSRIEIQRDLTSQEFKELMIVGGFEFEDLITKTFDTFDCQGYHLTLGIVDKDKPTSFCYGEIEFESEEEANAFIAPEWFGLEVTNDPYYRMSEYWNRTRKGDK